MDKFDIVDIYDENKNKTGKTKVRYNDPFEENDFILGDQGIIINSKGEILISRRSKYARILPLKWECNGGAVLSGEDILDALVREIHEELGIILDKEKAIYLKTAKNTKNHVFKEIYTYKLDLSIDKINFIDGEVIDVKWVTIDEFMNMFNNGDIVYNVNFDRNDYLKCLELLEIK